MVCPGCGSELRKKDKFCSQCGLALEKKIKKHNRFVFNRYTKALSISLIFEVISVILFQICEHQLPICKETHQVNDIFGALTHCGGYYFLNIISFILMIFFGISIFLTIILVIMNVFTKDGH